MIKALVSIIFIIVITIILTPAYGADSTPSADIQAKLETLKAEIASKAAKLKQEISRKLQNKAYVGIVKSKSLSTITLASKSGTKMVTANEDTIFQDTNLKAKNASLQAIKEETRIAALGDVDDTGVLTARKIVILPSTSPEPKIITWGQILSLSDDIAIVKDVDSKSISISLSKIDQKLKINDLVIITGVLNREKILEAGFIYQIPQVGSLTPKVTTSSASPSTSPKKGN